MPKVTLTSKKRLSSARKTGQTSQLTKPSLPNKTFKPLHKQKAIPPKPLLPIKRVPVKPVSTVKENPLIKTPYISVKGKANIEKRNKILERRKKKNNVFVRIKDKSLTSFDSRSLNPRPTKKHFSLKINFPLLLIGLLIIGILGATVQTKLFDVKQVSVEGGVNTNTSELKKYVMDNGGSGLIFNISPARLKRIIEQEFGFVQSATVIKDLPSSLRINIEEYVPHVIIETKNNAYLVTTDGVVLYKNVDSSKLKNTYTVIGLDDNVDYKQKEKININLINVGLDALKVASKEEKVKSFIMKIYPDNSADATVVYESDKTWLLTLTKKDLSSQYAILQQVKNLKNFKKLDTRFAGSYIIN